MPRTQLTFFYRFFSDSNFIAYSAPLRVSVTRERLILIPVQKTGKTPPRMSSLPITIEFLNIRKESRTQGAYLY